MQISGYGNKANLNTNHQRQNMAFGSKVEIDDTAVKKQLREKTEKLLLADVYDHKEGEWGIDFKHKKVPVIKKTHFTEPTIDKLTRRLTKLLVNNGQDDTVKISLNDIKQFNREKDEYMGCSITVTPKDGKPISQNFLAMPTFKNGKGQVTHSSSFFRNAVGAYEILMKNAQKVIK